MEAGQSQEAEQPSHNSDVGRIGGSGLTHRHHAPPPPALTASDSHTALQDPAATAALGGSSSQAALAEPAAANGDNSSTDDKKAGPAGSEAPSEEVVVMPGTYFEIAKYFGILGWTAFGGPAAHIAMFQKVRVHPHARVVALLSAVPAACCASCTPVPGQPLLAGCITKLPCMLLLLPPPLGTCCCCCSPLAP